MELIEKTLFARTLLAVAEIYEKSIAQDYIEIYWGALKEYFLDDIREAFGEHIKNTQTGMFMPKPADVIKQIEKNSRIISESKWDKVIFVMRRFGRYGHSELDSSTLNIVNSMGGWYHLCSLNDFEIQKLKSKFELEYFKNCSQYELMPIKSPNAALDGDKNKKLTVGTTVEACPRNVALSSK